MNNLHGHLIAAGYDHQHHDESYWEGGNAETGPKMYGHPAFEEYTSADDRIIIGEDGCFVLHEERDVKFEAWIESLETKYTGFVD